MMHPTGFEPVLPKESELESDALDHSAKDAIVTSRIRTCDRSYVGALSPLAGTGVSLDHSDIVTLIIKITIASS